MLNQPRSPVVTLTAIADQGDGRRAERRERKCDARRPPSAVAGIDGSGTRDTAGLDGIVNSRNGGDHAGAARALGKVTLPQRTVAAVERAIAISGNYRRIRALYTAGIAFGGETPNDDSIEQARPIVF